MRVTAIISLALTACTVRGFDRTTLLASTAALACDWRQTRAASSGGWSGRAEANPVMGPHPDTTTVDLYFVGVASANAMLWAALPRAWRSVIPGVVIGAQTAAIHNNNATIGNCLTTP